jgi:hypothetical protein
VSTSPPVLAAPVADPGVLGGLLAYTDHRVLADPTSLRPPDEAAAKDAPFGTKAPKALLPPLKGASKRLSDPREGLLC